MQAPRDTIAAIATPPGRGGVGIVRISGPLAANLCEQIVGRKLPARQAHYGPFHDHQGDALDSGIALFFQGPHSFTGEDVLELQGHGGPVVLDMLLQRALQLGARLARPGEFSEQAFLNDKLDLTQAEAIADLIDSASQQAARCAVRSLSGAFSARIEALVEQLIGLRMYVEAAIDFPEEEVDFLSDGRVARELDAIAGQFHGIQNAAHQGSLMREGMRVVLAGKPNAGKSSLMNALAGKEAAIVTAVAGTTRDVLQEAIHLDGMPLHLIDTAGLRDTDDEVERIGVERAWQAIEQADRILLLEDASLLAADRSRSQQEADWPAFFQRLEGRVPVTRVRNKIDLSGEAAGFSEASEQQFATVRLSASSGEGLDALKQHLKQCMGFDATLEGGFIARRRHLDALARAQQLLQSGTAQFHATGAGELLAEDLRHMQTTLGEITGAFTPDDLLGRIFSSFCIGK